MYMKFLPQPNLKSALEILIVLRLVVLYFSIAQKVSDTSGKKKKIQKHRFRNLLTKTSLRVLGYSCRKDKKSGEERENIKFNGWVSNVIIHLTKTEGVVYSKQPLEKLTKVLESTQLRLETYCSSNVPNNMCLLF